MQKQEKKRSEEMPTPSKSSRRTFLNKLWIGLGALALVEFAILLIAYLRPRKERKKPGEFGTIIEAGPVETFLPNSVKAFIQGKFYLCRLGDGGFLAVSRKCTHLGCTIPWSGEEKKFVCPCHASVFDIRGEVIGAPAPRALDIYRLFFENNIVKVDTGRLIKRSEFRADQVMYVKKA